MLQLMAGKNVICVNQSGRVYLGSYHFLLGGGGHLVVGGDQNFLGWSKGGPVLFFIGPKGGPEFFEGQRGGTNIFSFAATFQF